MHRFANCLVCGEVDYGAEFMAFENSAECVDIACIHFFEGHFAAYNFFYAFDCGRFAV